MAGEISERIAYPDPLMGMLFIVSAAAAEEYIYYEFHEIILEG